MSAPASHPLLIEAIYDAALDAGRWPQVLEGFARAFNSASAHLSCEDRGMTWGRLVSYGTDSSYARRYADYYVKRNVLWERIIQRRLNDVLTDRLIMPKEELEKSEFFNDFLKPQGGEEILAGCLAHRDDSGTFLTLWRPARHGAWNREDMDALSALLPHLRRAIQLNDGLGELRLSGGLACEALRHLEQSIVLVDGQSRVLFANRAAEALLTDAGGLRSQGCRLTARQPEEAAALKRLIAQAADGAGASLAVSRENRPALAVHVVPSRTGDCARATDRRGAIVFIRDPEQSARLPSRRFARHFGLTPAQAALAGEVARGEGVARAAHRLGISFGTARAHLLQVFQKTGTCRQAQLLRLMLEWREAPQDAPTGDVDDRAAPTRQKRPIRPPG